ncbi:MAG: ribbon-helix-helix domain-containing protein [Pseudomonadota bacterium]
MSADTAQVRLGRPVKHSLTLKGHRTSVTLEDTFWHAFREIAAERGIAINALAAEIDAARGMDSGLASAIRVHVLEHYRNKYTAGAVARHVERLS